MVASIRLKVLDDGGRHGAGRTKIFWLGPREAMGCDGDQKA